MTASEFVLGLGISAAEEWERCFHGTYFVKKWGSGHGWVSRCETGYSAKVMGFSGGSERSVGHFKTEELAKDACDQKLRELGAIRDPLLIDGKRHVVCVMAMRRGIDDRGFQRTYNDFYPFPDAMAVRAGWDYPLLTHQYKTVSLPHSLVLEGDTEVRAAQRAAYEQLGWETEARFYAPFMTDKVGKEVWTTYVYTGPWFRSTAWVEWWGLLNKSPERAYNRKLYELNSSIPAVTDTVEAALRRREHQRQLENYRQERDQTAEEREFHAWRREIEAQWRRERVR